LFWWIHRAVHWAG